MHLREGPAIDTPVMKDFWVRILPAVICQNRTQGRGEKGDSNLCAMPSLQWQDLTSPKPKTLPHKHLTFPIIVPWSKFATCKLFLIYLSYPKQTEFSDFGV